MNRIFSPILKINSRHASVQYINAICACTVPSFGSTYGLPNIIEFPKRFLYSKTILGLDGYMMQRERTLQQLSNIADKFRDKMRDYTRAEATSMIFTEDLKNMVHMAETTDIELIILMMKKFNSQNQELRFGSFVFGPVVMRMFYHLNSPDAALECFLDPSLGSFFDQVATYTLLLDLLFINGKYEELLKAYNAIRERQVGGKLGAPPRNVVVLTLAACYRMRTEAAVESALSVWRECSASGTSPMRRAATFLAGLCVATARPQVALEIVSSCNNQNYTTIRNIKVLALCQLGRREDAIPVLKSVFGQDNFSVGKHTFNLDIIAEVDESFKTETSTELKTEYDNIRKQLDSQNLITTTTLEEQLCSEISTPQFVQQNQRNNQSYNRQYDQGQGQPYRRQPSSNYSKPNRFTRPGLSDLQ